MDSPDMIHVFRTGKVRHFHRDDERSCSHNADERRWPMTADAGSKLRPCQLCTNRAAS